MTSHNHTIAGAAKGGLKSNYFSARNSPRASMCPFSKTVVWIVAALKFLKFVHLLSPQCDGIVDLMILMVLLN
jgi:hypothetical protein